MIINQPILLQASVNLREVVSEIVLLEVAPHVRLDAAWSKIARRMMDIIDCDQLVAKDPISYVCIDAETCVAFLFNSNMRHFHSASQHAGPDVELCTQGYYELSPDCPDTTVNLSLAIKVPDNAPSIPSQLLEPLTVQAVPSFARTLRLFVYFACRESRFGFFLPFPV